MQSLEYKEGYQAYLDGEAFNANPYKDDADKFEDWSDGYFQAWDDEDTKNY
jgi:ribosome modulation factor